MKKTVKQLENELNDVRETLKTFWELINNDENFNIYAIADNHGVRLSDAYHKKVMPLSRKLKKFMGIK
jgi:hypothetical protein